MTNALRGRASPFSTSLLLLRRPAMGNCLNPAPKDHHSTMPPVPEGMEEWCYTTPDATTTTTIGHVLREAEEETAAAAAAAGVKVKVVLKRAELEWLMGQLKTGDRRLEDVLNQMSTARAPPPPHRAGDGWCPRLERILECQEPAAA